MARVLGGRSLAARSLAKRLWGGIEAVASSRVISLSLSGYAFASSCWRCRRYAEQHVSNEGDYCDMPKPWRVTALELA